MDDSRACMKTSQLDSIDDKTNTLIRVIVWQGRREQYFHAG